MELKEPVVQKETLEQLEHDRLEARTQAVTELKHSIDRERGRIAGRNEKAALREAALRKKEEAEHEQLLKEGYVIETEWGIVALLASMSAETSPPVPATQVRNALGIQGGGNGAAINPVQYAAGVAYWTRYALVR